MFSAEVILLMICFKIGGTTLYGMQCIVPHNLTSSIIFYAIGDINLVTRNI